MSRVAGDAMVRPFNRPPMTRMAFSCDYFFLPW
jgi:hypothetical protein